MDFPHVSLCRDGFLRAEFFRPYDRLEYPSPILCVIFIEALNKFSTYFFHSFYLSPGTTSYYPFLLGQIRIPFYINIALGFKYAGDGVHLGGIGLHEEGSAGVEAGRGGGGDAPDEVEAVFSAVKGDVGFPPHFPGKGFDDGAGYVGGVADDEVKAGRGRKAREGDFLDAAEEIAFDELDGRGAAGGAVV
jgi:hypothetical protein